MASSSGCSHEAQKKPSSAQKVLCGLASGALQAGLFNPWDRALYLSITNRRRFLNPENWRSPYRGFSQSVFLRMISGGLYFPLEEIFMPTARGLAPEHPRAAHFLAGSAAGAVNAVIMNPLTSAKYALWSAPHMRYHQVIARMWHEGRAAPFAKGICATLARDITFGGVFALLRHRLPALMGALGGGGQERAEKGGTFLSDLVAASVATMLSSPFNYVRNVKYGLPASAPHARDVEVLAHLWAKAHTMRRRSGLLPALSLLQQRLRLGWGTLRAGVGMAVGAKLYNTLQRLLDNDDTSSNRALAPERQPAPCTNATGSTGGGATLPVSGSPQAVQHSTAVALAPGE